MPHVCVHRSIIIAHALGRFSRQAADKTGSGAREQNLSMPT
jgi:hypothetical protein